MALRLCGVPADVLTPRDVLAVFALTSVITIIPIAPGGAGVPELLYIAGLTSIAPGYEAQITAGVFLFRLYVWFLPIPIAWILLKLVRRGRPMLPTTGELRSYAASRVLTDPCDGDEPRHDRRRHGTGGGARVPAARPDLGPRQHEPLRDARRGASWSGWGCSSSAGSRRSWRRWAWDCSSPRSPRRCSRGSRRAAGRRRSR